MDISVDRARVGLARAKARHGLVVPSAGLVMVAGDTPLSMLELQSTNHTPFARNLRPFLTVMDKPFDVCVIDTNPGPDIRAISALASASTPGCARDRCRAGFRRESCSARGG